MFKKIIFVFAILVTALYVMPVIAQDACDGQVGSAFGLCNAYCEAMDCDSADPQASDNACNQVYDRFFTQTGSPPPCEVSCPCFTLDELQAGGDIRVCGELPGYNDIYGIIYTAVGGACSGIGCVSQDTLGCAYSVTVGSIVHVEPITEDEDVDCRALIMATCDTPN